MTPFDSHLDVGRQPGREEEDIKPWRISEEVSVPIQQHRHVHQVSQELSKACIGLASLEKGKATPADAELLHFAHSNRLPKSIGF